MNLVDILRVPGIVKWFFEPGENTAEVKIIGDLSGISLSLLEPAVINRVKPCRPDGFFNDCLKGGHRK